MIVFVMLSDASFVLLVAGSAGALALPSVSPGIIHVSETMSMARWGNGHLQCLKTSLD